MTFPKTIVENKKQVQAEFKLSMLIAFVVLITTHTTALSKKKKILMINSKNIHQTIKQDIKIDNI